ncbi:MAG: anti-sigma factor family protein [Sphingosinicella sp.]|uniref:anti-sigma factor family protein n=1 Tax=Sphingosinicella sp. TaxID=1917971 RepID=UPI0040380898
MAVDDDTLMAWLDGELNEVERRRVETALTEDPALAARLDGQRRLRDRLAAHYGPVADEDVPERFRAMLETNVVEIAAARPGRSRPLWQSLTAIAATLVLGIFVGRAWPESATVVTDEGVLVARGALAEALETQLASTQAADAATRIGVTFARADGSPCRTFEGGALSGIACRGGADWQLVMTAAGSRARQTDYRQAGGSAPLVLEAAQAMMAGEPLDAAGERRARDSGWGSVR